MRILIANLPMMLQQLVADAITSQTDITIVGQVQGYPETLLAIQDDVDIVILGEAQSIPLPNICSHLLSEFPHLKVLVLAPGSDSAEMYWLGLRQETVDMSTSAAIIDNLRVFHEIDWMD